MKNTNDEQNGERKYDDQYDKRQERFCAVLFPLIIEISL